MACLLPLVGCVILCKSLLLPGPLSSHLLKGALKVDQLKSYCGLNTQKVSLSAPCLVCALLLAPQIVLFLPSSTSHSFFFFFCSIIFTVTFVLIFINMSDFYYSRYTVKLKKKSEKHKGKSKNHLKFHQLKVIITTLANIFSFSFYTYIHTYNFK